MLVTATLLNRRWRSSEYKRNSYLLPTLIQGASWDPYRLSPANKISGPPFSET